MIFNSDFFGKISLPVPETEGIKYAGSKLKILPYILDIVSELNICNVLDDTPLATDVFYNPLMSPEAQHTPVGDFYPLITP